MKKLFFLFLLISAASFIMATITEGLFGSGLFNPNPNKPMTSYYWDDTVTGTKNTIFYENVSGDADWHINNEFSSIYLYSAAVRTEVVSTTEDMIHVSASVPDGKNISVCSYWSDSELYIEAHPKTVTFDDFIEDGVISWINDLIGDGSGIVIRIEIPEQILNHFELKQGSGTTVIRGIDTQNTILDIGSGTVNYKGNGNFRQSYFSLDMGSGNACVTNMLTDNYYIDIGSGKFAVSGLSGYGEIDMGSGSGSVFYSNIDGCTNIDIGSGSLNLYVPENTSAAVYTDIGSGIVNIDACGVSTKLTQNNDGEYTFIPGSYSDDIPNDIYDDFLEFFYDDIPEININMGSGKVNILDYSSDAEEDEVAQFDVRDPAAVVVPIVVDPSDIEQSTDVAGIIEAPDDVEQSAEIGFDINTIETA